MRRALLIMLLSLLGANGLQAQDIRYVSDKQYIPLRSGAGGEYRIIHRGIPSGTRLTVARTANDGEWAEIRTDRGTTGWIRTQYLMKEVPAQNQLDAATRKAEQLAEQNAQLSEELETLNAQRSQLSEQLSNSDSQLGNISDELAQLKQLSGKAVQLDTDNRRLVLETETLRSQVETLEAENQRLQDKLKSEDFINGALAVLLGVIITLVVPRVWPRRRKSSSWA